MLERALHSEVDTYLGRRRYDRVEDDFSGYRNGYAREREISIGIWSVEVRPPRIAATRPVIQERHPRERWRDWLQGA